MLLNSTTSNDEDLKKILLELGPDEELSEVEKKYSLNALRIFKDRYLLKSLMGFTIKDRHPIYKTVERLDDLFKRVAVSAGLMEVLYDPAFYDKNLKPTDAYFDVFAKEMLKQAQKNNEKIDYRDLQDNALSGHWDEFPITPFHVERLLARYIEIMEEDKMKVSIEDISLHIDNNPDIKQKYLPLIKQYYYLMYNGVFLPNTPALMNAGTKIAQNAACFTLPVYDDMESIIKTQGDVMRVFKSGGGIGINYSELRPSGSFINSTGGTSPGPMTFLKIMDEITGGVKQGGKRRGAAMAELDVDHPDIESFIDSKVDNKSLTNHNISVVANNKFFRDYLKGDEKAVRLMDKIAKNAWVCADPGMVFLENMNSNNLLQSVFGRPIKVTNPCVSGRTRIATNKGLLTVEELYKSQESIIVTSDNRGFDINKLGVQLRKAKPIFKTADNTDIWTIKTKEGFEIEATNYHEFITPNGRKELKNLKIGDVLLVQSDEGQWGNYHNPDLAIITGAWQADGTTNKDKNRPQDRIIRLDFHGKDKDLSKKYIEIVNKIIPISNSNNHIQQLVLQKSITDNKYFILSSRLGLLFNQFNIQKNIVPDFIWISDKETVKTYIQSLFDFDGNISLSGKNNSSCVIRLSNTSKKFLQDIQILLSNFGIFSYIQLCTKGGNISFKNRIGITQNYSCKSCYNLIISGSTKNQFIKHINFSMPYKLEKVNIYLQNKIKNSQDIRKFRTIIDSIEYKGKEAVYDTTEPITHTLTFNGLVSGNCSEIAMYEMDSCNLASINLTKFVTSDGKFDIEGFINVTRIVTRFLDGLIDSTKYPIEEINEMTKKGRRIGVGFMGLGDVLTIMGIPYNSEDGFLFTEYVTALMSMASLIESNRQGDIKGSFPLWYDDKYPKEEIPVFAWSSGAAEDLEERIEPLSKYFKYQYTEDKELFALLANMYDTLELKRGMRNCSTTTIAPTGTLSMFVDCSSGIEPVFSHGFTKKVTVGEFNYINKHLEDVLHKEGIHSTELISKIVKENAGSLYNIKGLPEHIRKVFVTAMDIHPFDHLVMQASAQKWITNGISKTINAPEDIDEELVKNIYVLAWELGCKGTTVYRNNCKSVQVLNNLNSINKPKIADLKISEYTKEYIQDLDLPEDFKNKLLGCDTIPSHTFTIHPYRITTTTVGTNSFTIPSICNNGQVTFVGNCTNCGAQNSHERSGSPSCFLCRSCGSSIGSCS